MNEAESLFKNIVENLEDTDSGEFRTFRKSLIQARKCDFDPRRLKASRTELFDSLISYARRNCGYYKNLFKNMKTTSPEHIRRLPPLERQQLKEDIKAIIPDTVPRSCLNWIYTAGTVASPIRIPTIGFNLERQALLILSSLKSIGVRFGPATDPGNILQITTLGKGLSFSASPRTLNGGRFSGLRLPLRNKDALFDLCRYILKDIPGVLTGSPEALILFARTVKKLRKRIPAFKAVISTERSLFPAAREYIEDAYSVGPLELYFLAEAGPVAMECDRRQGMHLLHPDIHIEVLDRLGRPQSARNSGEIEITTSLNGALPLIRYRTGDLGMVSRAPCPCGSHAPRLMEVQPKSAGLFTAVGTGINIAETHKVIGTLPLIRYRLVQRDEDVLFEYHSLEPARKVEPLIHAVVTKMFSPYTRCAIKRQKAPARSGKSVCISAELKKSPVRVGIRRTGLSRDELKTALLDCLADLDLFDKFNGPGGRVLVMAGGGDACAAPGPLRSMLQALNEAVAGSGGELFTWPAAETPAVRKTKEFDYVINLAECRVDERETYSGATHNMAPLTACVEEERPFPDELHFELLREIKPDLNVSIVRTGRRRSRNGEILLLVSDRALALDRVATEILGMKAGNSPLFHAAAGTGFRGANLSDIRISGIPPEVGRRPCPASPRPPRSSDRDVIAVHNRACTLCGRCAQVCPAGCISLADNEISIDQTPCIRCYNCVEFCEEDALSPLSGPDLAVSGKHLIDRGPWLSYLSGARPLPGCHPYPPSYLAPDSSAGTGSGKKPVYILGLAINTMQEHAAALIRDGEIVGAVEEERFRRVKHYGWTPPASPGSSLSSDPLIPLEQAFCRNSINALLAMEDITMDDVDYIAVNGIPARYRNTFCNIDPSRPPRIVKSGRLIFVPHHLAHAASAYRVSGFRSAPVFTVDGSGDRETAAFFLGRNGELEMLFDVLTVADCSIGGVYETATRILGFGDHGQGSTMALAAMGQAKLKLSEFFSLKNHKDTKIHEWSLFRAFRGLERDRAGLLIKDHRDFAASVQKALEQVCIRLVEEGLAGREAGRLCLAGGVALNCTMNRKIRTEFGLGDIMIQPAAHDAGTALGAALEAYHFLFGKSPAGRMKSAYLGPGYDRNNIRKTLDKMGAGYTELRNPEKHCAELISQGKIVCRYHGRMEYGPRALGNRSILADPRDPKIKEKLNRMKSREPWRPFGPSVLRGKESLCFENSFYSPFMLFTFDVRPGRRDELPAIVHHDGTTRPQSVDRSVNKSYHDLISHFEKLTSVPMVVNTSFNTGDEPIVCTPEEAIKSFARLGADYLAIEDFLVSRDDLLKGGCKLKDTAAMVAAESAPAPIRFDRGKRLHLRLSVTCNNNCRHCTIGDIRGMKERTTAEAIEEMRAGVRAGCTELVFMRGEVTLRDDAVYLVGRARDMGYRHIQIQTNGRMLSYKDFLVRLVGAGASHFEVSLFGDSAAIHDGIAGSAGAFAQTVKGLKNLVGIGAAPMVTVPVIKANYERLTRIVHLLNRLGIQVVQFNFSRPVRVEGEVITDTIVRLGDASPRINEAMLKALDMGMAPSAEAVPVCHLDPEFRRTGETGEDWDAHMVSDLHIKHDSGASQRKETRPRAPECAGCDYEKNCPTTWSIYQELFGTSEMKRIT